MSVEYLSRKGLPWIRGVRFHILKLFSSRLLKNTKYYLAAGSVLKFEKGGKFLSYRRKNCKINFRCSMMSIILFMYKFF